jgi:hypothetical protein
VGLNYYDTFIEAADDCPVAKAETPQPKGGKKTQAVLEYEMIANNPYQYTEEDVSFETFAIRHGILKVQWPEERKKYLAEDHPCLRGSALGKRYGWGIRNNKDGKVALLPIESAAYRKFRTDPKLQHVKALRSKRA